MDLETLPTHKKGYKQVSNPWEGLAKNADPNNCKVTMADLVEENKENAYEGKSSENVTTKDFEEEQNNANEYLLVAVNKNGKLGQIYKAMTNTLLRRGGWRRKKGTIGRFHMVFGESKGAGIPWKKFSQCFKYDYGIKPLVNYGREFNGICRQADLVQTLRAYSKRSDKETNIIPESYIIFSPNAEISEMSKFEMAWEKHSSSKTNVWQIIRSDGKQATEIKLMDSLDDIIDFVGDLDPESSPTYVARKYDADKFFLFNGSKKISIRMTALLDAEYNVHVYDEIVAYKALDSFKVNQLTNKFAHLPSPAVQKTHRDFPESGNYVFAKELRSALRDEDIRLDDLVSDMHNAIKTCFLALKEKSESRVGVDFSTFQIFGFDFWVMRNGTIKLANIDSSPSVAKKHLSAFVDSVITVAIDPVYPVSAEGKGLSEGKESSSSSGINNFECIYRSRDDIKQNDDAKYKGGFEQEGEFEIEFIGAAKRSSKKSTGK